MKFIQNKSISNRIGKCFVRLLYIS